MIRSLQADNFVKGFESLELVGYADPIGIPTIGWGHIGEAAVIGKKITKEEAQRLYDADARNVDAAINLHVLSKGVTLNQNQYDALFSLVFNLGPHNIFTKVYQNGYKSGSVLYNKLLQRDYEAVADRFTDFVKAGGKVLNGLVRRREAEARMFKKKACS